MLRGGICPGPGGLTALTTLLGGPCTLLCTAGPGEYHGEDAGLFITCERAVKEPLRCPLLPS